MMEQKKLLKIIKTLKVINNSKNWAKALQLKRENIKNKNIILMDGDLEIDIDSVIKLIKI